MFVDGGMRDLRPVKRAGPARTPLSATSPPRPIVAGKRRRCSRPSTGWTAGGGSGCPAGTKLAVRVTWEGGVTKPDGSDADDEDRDRYEVVFSDQGEDSRRTATALADLGDGDNNHLLCFDTVGSPSEVRFPAGFFTDPRDDLNPDTSAPVRR